MPVEVDFADAGSSLPVVVEREPNQWPEMAQHVHSDTLIRGHIGPPLTKRLGDRDVYCFKVPGARRQVLRASLSGVDRLVLSLEIRTARWGHLASARSEAPGKGVVIPNLSVLPGRYCLIVQEARGGPPYRFDLKTPYGLQFTLSPESPREEREPNDRFWAANPLAPGQWIEGMLGRAKDKDWYRVPLTGLPADSLLEVTLRGVAGVTARVGIYDWARRLIASRIGTRGATVRLLDLRVALHTGVVFVLVSGGKRFNPDARYRLAVAASRATSQREVEPNDSPARSVRLGTVRGVIRGIIEVGKDVDWYTLPLPGRADVRLSLQVPPELDGVLQVTDFRGRRIATADRGRAGEAELLPNVYASSGVRIRVSGARRTFAPKHSYVLRWEATPATRGDEREPNNRPGQATRLVPGVSARGFIYPAGDRDWYWFRLPGRVGSTHKILLAVQGLPSVRLRLLLLDAHKEVLSTSRRPTSEGLRTLTTLVHSAQRYYVRIEDESGRRVNATDDYELRLSLVRL